MFRLGKIMEVPPVALEDSRVEERGGKSVSLIKVI